MKIKNPSETLKIRECSSTGNKPFQTTQTHPNLFHQKSRGLPYLFQTISPEIYTAAQQYL